ncbi:MAG: hypothetical protein HQL51_05730 [Magnetococcales bacterium]|nr:hypothetical protein [Magnetococcales bacterium]
MRSINPEIQKAVWTELTPTRLIMTPLLLLLLGSVVQMGERSDQDVQGWYTALFAPISFLSVYYYGNQKIAVSVLSEISQKSWEYQRLSALSPWSLTWGKMVGGMLFPWYVGLPSLLAVQYYGQMFMRWEHLIPLILLAMTLHAFVLYWSLMIVRKSAALQYPITRYTSLFGLFPALFALWVITIGKESFAHPERLTSWYEMNLDHFTTVTLTLLLACSWMWLAAWRAMRSELQVRQYPWAWFLFVLMLVVYLGGFIQPRAGMVSVGFTISILFFYQNLFSETKDLLLVRQLQHHWRQRNWLQLGNLVPQWVISFFMVLIFWGLSLFFWPTESETWSFVLLTSIVLFSLRDLALVLFFSLGINPKRRDAAAFFYLSLSYALPILLLSTMSASTRESYSLLFYPPFSHPKAVDLLLPLAEAVLLWFLVIARYRQRQRETKLDDQPIPFPPPTVER